MHLRQSTLLGCSLSIGASSAAAMAAQKLFRFLQEKKRFGPPADDPRSPNRSFSIHQLYRKRYGLATRSPEKPQTPFIAGLSGN